MKPLIAAIAILAVFPPLQDYDSVFPKPSPNAKLWLKHLEKMEHEELSSSGVPDHYHYLYSLRQTDDAATRP